MQLLQSFFFASENILYYVIVSYLVQLMTQLHTTFQSSFNTQSSVFCLLHNSALGKHANPACYIHRDI